MKKIISIFKEIFTGHFSNGVIKNCSYGSFTYWHEHRHKQQMSSTILKTIWIWLPYSTAILGISLWILVLLCNDLSLFNYGGYILFPISLFVFVIEVDANIYAIRHKIKQYENQKRWK